MNTTILLSIALALFLVALPLTSLGAMEENELLWGAGLALLVVAGIIPPASRFLPGDDEDEEGDEHDTAGNGEKTGNGEKADKADKAEDRRDDGGLGRDADSRRRGQDRDRGRGAPTPPAHPRATEPPPGRNDPRSGRRRAEEQRKRGDEADPGGRDDERRGKDAPGGRR